MSSLGDLLRQAAATADTIDAAVTNAHAENDRLRARVAELEAAQPKAAGTVFSVDLGDIPDSPDAPISEAIKVRDHKTLLQTDSIQRIRVFFGSAVPRWDDERIAALGASDSLVISTLSRDRAGLAAFLANTPKSWPPWKTSRVSLSAVSWCWE